MAGPGLLSTILDTTGERVKERLAGQKELDDELRKTQTESLLKSIYAVDENGKPKLSEADAEDAWGRLEALHKHNKSIKDILGKARDITGKIFGFGNPAMVERQAGAVQKQLDPAQSPATATQNPTEGMDPAVAETYSGLAAPPARTSATPTAQAAPALTQPPARSTASLIRAGAPNPVATEIAKEKRNTLAESEKLKQQHQYKMDEIEATAKTHGDKKIGSYIGEDQKTHLIFMPAGGGPGDVYEIDSEGKTRPYVSRLSPGSKISVTDAQSLADATGQQFLDEAGQPIDLTKLNIGMELVPITGGMPNRYKAGTQNRVTQTFDNKVVVAPALERGNAAAQTVQGAARVPTDSTSETIVINPEGEAEAATLRQSSTPRTPAPATQTPAAVAPPGSLTPPPARTTPVTTPAPAPAGGGNRTINGLPAAERKSQLEIARPVRAAAVQLFGDPKNPNVESLMTFAKLADNPESRARVGTAARMIINDLTAADKAGGIGAQILGEGASLHGGDIWQVIKNKAGMPQWLASSQVSATESALKALTPEESRMLNQIMAAYGTVVGLRTLTKGGAYQFSVASMERELPIPGIADVNSSAVYNNKLAKIANEVVEGSKGISDTVLPEKKFYLEQADKLNKLGQGTTVLPGPPARGSGPAVPETKEVGGVTYYKVPGGWSKNKPK